MRRRLRSRADNRDASTHGTDGSNSGSRPTKQKRRSRAEIEALEEEIFDTCEEMRPLSLRGLFYQLASRGVIPKTEAEYRTVVRLSGRMRERGDLPFEWLVDSTRLRRKPMTHDNLATMMDDSARLYRRALWRDQPWYSEVWCEKDTLTGVLFEVTAEWDVPLMICRGYASKTSLHSAAREIEAHDKPTAIFYLGDYDPSGQDIARNVEEGLKRYAPYQEIEFVQLAVTEEQVDSWQLPTRPTKKTDSRAANFTGESVEVDAVPPDRLRGVVREAIEGLIDHDALEHLRRLEAAERHQLQTWRAALAGAGG